MYKVQVYSLFLITNCQDMFNLDTNIERIRFRTQCEMRTAISRNVMKTSLKRREMMFDRFVRLYHDACSFDHRDLGIFVSMLIQGLQIEILHM